LALSASFQGLALLLELRFRLGGELGLELLRCAATLRSKSSA